MARYLRFQLERWLQRGVFHRLLFAAALIAAISVLGGLAAWWVTDEFEGPLDAIWWSFLRLSDPGYLGDDEGAVLRFISTIVTVLGYVLFLGSLVAIMTQWLNETLSRFEQGLSTLSMQGHVVILGWTNRTPDIVRQLLAARGRLRRFLDIHGQRRLRIVIVADEVNTERRLRLRSYLENYKGPAQVFLRSGTATVLGDLSRFDLGRAAVIVVPGDEFRYGGVESSDARVIKSLLNLRSYLHAVPAEERPFVLAEVLDAGKEPAVMHAYDGPMEVVPGNAVIARFIAQAILDPRLAAVFLELSTHNEGCSPFVRAFPEFIGQQPLALSAQLDRAIVIGAVRKESGKHTAHLNPPPDFRMTEGDQLVFIARTFDDCAAQAGEVLPVDESPLPQPRGQVTLKLLVLGWSPYLGQIFEQLLVDETSTVNLTLVSRMPVDRRILWGSQPDHLPDRVETEHIEADIIGAGTICSLDLGSYDSVLLVATPHRQSAVDSDARALTAYELLRAELLAQCPDGRDSPTVLVEASHSSSSRFVTEPGDVLLIRPRLLGFLQSHVALRPELNAVFEALFLPSGHAQVALRESPKGAMPLRYTDLVRTARARGDIALGVLLDAGTQQQDVVLCPAADFEWNGTADLIVLTAGNPAS